MEPRHNVSWEEVRDRLNQKLRGWAEYFGLGSTARAYRVLDGYVYDRVRHFLRRRHQVFSQGTRQFPEERVFSSLDVIRLQGPTGAFVSLRPSQSESRMREIRTSGLMSGVGNRDGAVRQHPRPTSTLRHGTHECRSLIF